MVEEFIQNGRGVNMELPSRIFFTGVPGSKWSGIAQVIESILNLNTSDRTPEREYTHEKFSGHKGAYFGTGMEFPPNLKLVDNAHTSMEGSRLIKSHDWSYMLDDIRKEYPLDWIILVYRNSAESFRWWKQAGGFDITYPKYDAYVDDLTMRKEIARQNELMVNYTIENNIMWQPFNEQFFKGYFDIDTSEIDYNKWNGIYITIIK